MGLGVLGAEGTNEETGRAAVLLHAGRAEVFEYNPRNWNSKERKIGGVQNSLLGVAEAIFAEEVGTRADIVQIRTYYVRVGIN